MDKVKTAVMGGGWFGQFHVDALLTMPDVEVVAVAAPSEKSRAALLSKAPSARVYTDACHMVKNHKDRIDAMVVCVPPDSHDGVEALAAKHHIHLYMEKPLGVSWEQIQENNEAITQSGIICSVGYQTRYNPLLDEMKAYLSNKTVGSVVAKWFGVMPQTPWWRKKARSGGQLSEQVTHMVDALRYLFGDVEAVYSLEGQGIIRDVPDFDIADRSASIMKFASGILASVNCGCFIDPVQNTSEILFEIYSPGAYAEYRWDTSTAWGNKQGMQKSTFGNDFHRPALAAFITAVRTGDSSLIRSSYQDAMGTFATTYAAGISARQHREVPLSELWEETR